MSAVKQWFDVAGYVVEAAGVLTIVIGALLAALWFPLRLRTRTMLEAYSDFRSNVGRSIILGLEFLIAGDIIRTVTVTQTLESVGVLVVIVLIRSFLTLTLELEIEGRWPWQRTGQTSRGPRGETPARGSRADE
ncbi:MAG: DUF1622 domain-containing protein [Gammaproteobacteria bacterium]|nr:DUF1622 domain-containing protein [Gammaproteobacteria bacterium]MDH5255345.1 DUF1622 domain-containing protein [Gammaproteobacteria bacterium]